MKVNIILENLFQEADLRLKEKKYQVAYDLLTEIVATDSTFGKAYNHLGWLFETKYQKLVEAEEYYKLAIHHSPNYLSTYYNYAILLAALKRWDELNVLLDKTLTIPACNRSTVFNEYGIMFELLEEWDKAIQGFEKAIRSTSDNKRIARYKTSIDRVKQKIDLFGN